MKQERKNGQKTREKIVDAARVLFLARGYSATSMDDIAKVAEVNKSLIFHHFESKEQLWKMVKSSIVSEAGDHKVEFDSSKRLKEFIEGALRARFDLYTNYPDLARMIAWQRLEEQAAPLEGTPHLPSLAEWLTTLRKLQQQKKLRSDIDASLILDFIFNQRPEKAYLEANSKQQQNYFQMVVDALCAGLAP